MNDSNPFFPMAVIFRQKVLKCYFIEHWEVSAALVELILSQLLQFLKRRQTLRTLHFLRLSFGLFHRLSKTAIMVNIFGRQPFVAIQIIRSIFTLKLLLDWISISWLDLNLVKGNSR